MSRSQTAEPGAQPHGSIWTYPGMTSLAGYTFFVFTGFFVTLAALPAALARGGMNDSIAGSVTAVLLATTVVCQLLVPAIVARVGIAPVLAAAALLLGVPALMLLHNGPLWWVMLSAVLRGAGFAGATVLGSTLTARIVPVHRRGEAIGAYGLAVAIPNLVALPAGVALAGAYGPPPIAVLGAFPVVGLVFVAGLARAGAAEPTPVPSTATAAPPVDSSGVSRRAAAGAAIPPSLALLAVTLAGGAFLTYVPIVRPEGQVATVALAGWGVTGALLRWRIGGHADRRGLRRLLPGALVVTIAGVAFVVWGLVAGDGWGAATLVLLGGIVLGAGFGATQNLTLMAAFARARHHQPATVSSIWNAGFDLGTALGAALVGAMIIVMPVWVALAFTGLLVLVSLPLAVRSAQPPAAE